MEIAGGVNFSHEGTMLGGGHLQFVLISGPTRKLPWGHLLYTGHWEASRSVRNTVTFYQLCDMPVSCLCLLTLKLPLNHGSGSHMGNMWILGNCEFPLVVVVGLWYGLGKGVGAEDMSSFQQYKGQAVSKQGTS